jgi:hypothetical protein
MSRTRLDFRKLTGNGFWALLLFAVALVSADNFADPDLWMHILAGRLILAGHIPPMTDPFSYSTSGMAWRDHEWLAQAALALSYDTLGVLGLKLLKMFCAAIAMASLAIGISQTAAGTGAFRRVALIVTAMLMVEPMQFRPQLFTFAMLSAELAILAIEIYWDRAPLWVLVPIFALWVNLHGGYAAGLGALGVATAVVALQSTYRSSLRRKAGRLIIVTVLCSLATLLNPFGLSAAKTVMHSVSDPLIRQLVVEWRSLPQSLAYQWHNGPRAAVLIGIAPPLLFVFFVAMLVRAPNLDDAPMVAVALVFICAGIYQARNVSLAVLAVAIPLAHHSALAFKSTEDDRPAASGLMVALAIVVMLAGGSFSRRLQTWSAMPSGVISFMNSNHLRGNILNQLEWGEYLAWHEPDSRIFVDGRAETVYSDNVMLEYAKFYYGVDGGDKLLDACPNDFVLLIPTSKAYQTMLSERGWRLIYRDKISALFQRTSLAAGATSSSSSTSRSTSQNSNELPPVNAPSSFP